MRKSPKVSLRLDTLGGYIFHCARRQVHLKRPVREREPVRRGGTRHNNNNNNNNLSGLQGLNMSHVQLSSSALERLVARRTFPLHRRTSVCRNLFGPVDHDELSRDVKARLREISERDQQRWNFNFEANAPLDGDYEWEEVPADKTPAFYQESSRNREPATPVKQRPLSDPAAPEREPPTGDVTERLTAPGSSGAPAPLERNQENRADKLNSGTHRPAPCVRHKRTAAADSSNAHITDFFVKRRRAADSCHRSKSPIPVEQTPRNRIR